MEQASNQAEECLKTLMAKEKVGCGLPMDANRVIMYFHSPILSLYTFSKPRIFAYKDEIVELLDTIEYFANSDYGSASDD
ncbi:hypothetical protein DL89DRAFT_266301, partial [Linderina pennispora]